VTHAVDALGCGDALLSAATLALSCGAPLTVAALIGSIAASAEAERVGNAPIAASEIRKGVQRLTQSQPMLQPMAPLRTAMPLVS
ncbi:MAG: hypothetical protein VYC34_02665, partial [Planctomycetota bacterium]|nr:hypothetical protein [Planctomycetota bacterium]